MSALTKRPTLEGGPAPLTKRACFVLYLKIVNTFLKNNIVCFYTQPICLQLKLKLSVFCLLSQSYINSFFEK